MTVNAWLWFVFAGKIGLIQHGKWSYSSALSMPVTYHNLCLRLKFMSTKQSIHCVTSNKTTYSPLPLIKTFKLNFRYTGQNFSLARLDILLSSCVSCIHVCPCLQVHLSVCMNISHHLRCVRIRVRDKSSESLVASNAPEALISSGLKQMWAGSESLPRLMSYFRCVFKNNVNLNTFFPFFTNQCHIVYVVVFVFFIN